MFDKVQETQTNQKTEALIQMEENTNKFKEKLKIENDIINKQSLKQMEENTNKFKEKLKNNNLPNNDIEKYLKENSNKNTESPYNIIEKNFNPYSTNKEELIMKEKTLEFIKKLEEENKKAH